MKKTDLVALKKLLADLKKEATQMGLPMARIRDVDELQKTITLVEKNRG